MVFADCTIGVAWTPDPVGAPAIVSQEIWHNPTTAAGDEVVRVTLGATDNTGSFTVTDDCSALPDQTVFVKTKYLGDVEVDSAEVAPSDVVGAILQIAVQHTQ